MRWKIATAAAALAVVSAAGFAPAAGAAPTTTTTTTCDDSVSPVAGGATVAGNLVVPAGASCYLFYATVKGNTSVAGTLYADATTFNKNVSVNGGTLMNINRAFTVKGNLSITNSSGINGTWEQYNDVRSVVEGNFSYTYNSGPLFISYLGLEVKGNFTFAYNAPSATDWPYTLGGLTVDGNSTIL